MYLEKVYEAFGELLYAVSLSDGELQEAEEQRLKEVLSGHEWEEDILWSFNYEKGRHRSVKDAYARALDVFAEYGPYKEYNKFFDVLEKVAEASAGIDEAERALIDSFKDELLERFKNDERIQ